MNDEYGFEFDRAIGMLVIGGLILLVLIFGGNKPAPGNTYADGSYNTSIHIEDNDTTVCVGFCPNN